MLDQLGIERFAEKYLMPDRVEISRDGGEPVLDSETGRLEPAPSRDVYEGPAGFYPKQERIRSRSGLSGAWVDEVRPAYRLLLPLRAGEVWESDSVVVTQARDEQAVGRTYTVTALGEVSSFPVVRTVWLEEHNRAVAS
ncbi:DUF6093 family protein [Streptomyces sp. NPDC047968]|uniref:DUF6093 family protein n=1 Tax=unclassified Streptomyces TaxID=2593676 RepID=UPI0034296253